MPNEITPTTDAPLTLLIVEDETMVAMLLEQMLEELGCASMRMASNLNDGLAAVAAEAPDAAALDVNLRGVPVFPLAEALAALRHGLDAPAGHPELLAEDLRLAMRAIGRITGRVDVEELLDFVFRDFCIGK